MNSKQQMYERLAASTMLALHVSRLWIATLSLGVKGVPLQRSLPTAGVRAPTVLFLCRWP